MITSICCVYDTVANLYGAPFCSTNAAVAVRQFQAELTADAHGAMQTHPDNFKLFELGSFDNTHGRFQLYDQPLFLYQGTAL